MEQKTQTISKLNNSIVTTEEGKQLPYFPKGYKLPIQGLSKYQTAKYTKKIKDCDTGEISGVILGLCAIVGLPKSSYPADADKKLLIQLVKTQLKNVSIEEIKLAFIEATKQSFEIDLKTFGAFSFEYINRILNSYNDWIIRRRIIKPLEPVQHEPTEEEKKERNLIALKNNCKQIFKDVDKGTHWGKIFIQPELYDLLKQNDLMKGSNFPKIDFEKNGYKNALECCIQEYQKIKQEEPIKLQDQENRTDDGKKMAILWTVQNWISKHANSEITTLIEGLKWAK